MQKSMKHLTFSINNRHSQQRLKGTLQQGALKPGSVGALLPGNLLSHRKFEVELGNNARNFLSPQSVVPFLLSQPSFNPNPNLN